jgi:hypothetical protein
LSRISLVRAAASLVSICSWSIFSGSWMDDIR